MSKCNICTEPFNKTNRLSITCNFCQFVSCRLCIKTYLLGQSAEAHCMSCRHEWDVEFMRISMTRAFMDKEYKIHRENMLLEREKSMLPSAQLELERQDKLQELRNELFKLERIVYLKKVEIDDFSAGRISETKENRREFIKQCPVNECRGFLSTQWICGVCKSKSCKDCHEVLTDDEHKCDPSLVDSIKLMKSDSKACPGCGIYTLRQSGCNQMWCVQCHTAWNWVSGRIEKGLIHNPHFYQWQLKNGNDTRNPMDIRCGGLVNLYDLSSILREENCYVDIKNILTKFHRSVGHIRAIIERLPGAMYNPQLDMDLRLQYLRKKISESEWKITLQRRYKKREKDRLYREILDTYTTVIQGLLGELVNRNILPDECTDQCYAILLYCNTQIVKLKKLFNSNISIISI
jgi:hypothetical protein